MLGSSLGVFISHLPARNPLGKNDIFSEEGCLGSKLQVPSENKMLMRDFYFYFELLGRERLSDILPEYSLRSL